MSAAIELRNVAKHFGRVRAVDGITLLVPEKALFGLIGPNGAGKTTTFGLLSGFLHPTSGEVLVRGEPLSPSHPPVGKVLALPQDAQLPDRIRVLDVLVLLGRFGGLHKLDAKQQAERALSRVGLGDLAERRVGELSHGQRRRVGIAQTLIGENEVILLDEPTAGLDARSAAELRLLIKDLHQDRTIVLSSHNLQEVEQLCDSAAILDHGRIVAEGSMESIKGTSTIVEVQLAKAPADAPKIIDALRALTVVRSATMRDSGLVIDLELADEKDGSGEDVTNQVLRVLLEQGASVKGIERGKSLEERFLEETKSSN
jgi:ABC-type multidrug transport system ATPase subunit